MIEVKPVGFKSFLTQYAKSMSDDSSLSLSKAERVVQQNERFLSIFLLLLLFDEKKANTLAKNPSRFPQLWERYIEVRRLYTKQDLQSLDDYVNRLHPFDELRKAYTSYLRNVLQKKHNEKASISNEITKILQDKNISIYRVYKDLELNPGNVNDFFKNKRFEKLSIETLKIIYNYVNEKSIPSE